jgi:hypothetical protein
VAGNLRQTQNYEPAHGSIMIPLIMR